MNMLQPFFLELRATPDPPRSAAVMAGADDSGAAEVGGEFSFADRIENKERGDFLEYGEVLCEEDVMFYDLQLRRMNNGSSSIIFGS